MATNEYENLYLKYLSDKKGIDINTTLKSVNKCIEDVADMYRVSLSTIYNIVYSKEFLAKCLKGKCSNLDAKKCEESCHCIYFEGKCYPRYFDDAEIMNRDPDAYVLKMPTDELNKLVRLASYLYYNYDGGGITDNTFDAFEYNLNKRLKLKGRRYEKIGAPPIDKIREKLPYPMASLEKVKPGTRELLNFLSAAGKEIWWSVKLDGVSGMLVYSDGLVKKAYTRGDGNIGGDVTYMIDHITFPSISDVRYKNIVVRGEFIISRALWEKYKYIYSNPRCFVTAKINAGYVSIGIDDITFVAYDIIDTGSSNIPMPDTQSDTMTILNTLKFNVVDSGIINNPTTFDLINLYKKKRVESDYNIDGIVIAYNKRENIDLSKNPKTKVAFKMKLQEQIRTSTVINVDWNVTRYGRLVPVVIFKSVYIDGVRLHRASAFNASHIRDWSLGKGTEIKVIRSGDVIPSIIDVKVDNFITPLYPDPIVPGSVGSNKGWHWSGSDIIANDIINNKIIQLKKSEHFFRTIGVPLLGEKTLEKLWDSGMRSIKSITSATVSDFVKIKGIGEKLANRYYINIHDTMRNTRLDRYIPASTVLQMGIGRKLIKQILNYHPTLMEDTPEELEIILSKKQIPGIGKKRIRNLVDNITKFKEFLYSLNKEDITYAIKHDSERIKNLLKNNLNSKIKGKVFVLTGFYGKINYELEDAIYDNFGIFSNVVAPGIEAVITANINNVTNKMLTAERYGIKILMVEEFMKEYINSKKDYDTNNKYQEEEFINEYDPTDD